MSFVCLSSPAWPTDAARSAELVRRALLAAPRIRFEPARGLLWADARGLDGPGIAAELAGLARALGSAGVGAGVAGTPIAALAAARMAAASIAPPDPAGSPSTAVPESVRQSGGPPARGGRKLGEDLSPPAPPIAIVPPGGDRAFLAPLDLGQLDPPPPPHFYPLLAGIGIENCGDLARLDAPSVEVRFGAEGIRLWRLARGDDPHPIFGPRVRDLPSAELEWVDYELENQEQVTFIVNSLLATVCDQLGLRREGAHGMVLDFSLADRSRVELPIRCSHPTAERRTWLRVIRAALEPVTFAAAVMRIGLRVAAAAPLADRQGDLFDAGFATERMTETALAHLLDHQSDALVVAERTLHPLPEERIRWPADPAGQFAARPLPGASSGDASPRLSIQILPAPRTIDVRSVLRRGSLVPDRYFDGTRNYTLNVSLGPDRVSGGFGETQFDRDYFQGVRPDGVMVLLYRDRARDTWHLAGWWD